ncbi:hypothetical protein LSAT2_016644 [Lamellibrachia satsuma]|nr:hypothetical protein LSAT2_016644 [Lamellibrachia satsuma]
MSYQWDNKQLMRRIMMSYQWDNKQLMRRIMMSYQWDNKQLMRRIGDELKEAGFKVWMDVYDMSGSTLEAMAAAVEEASMVLIAASTKYKDSASCRTEGEYAYNNRREIVPVIVEPDYKPDGWLGPLVLNHLYFDFTDDTNFGQKMKELINEIQRRGQARAHVRSSVLPPILHTLHVGRPVTAGHIVFAVAGLVTDASHPRSRRESLCNRKMTTKDNRVPSQVKRYL